MEDFYILLELSPRPYTQTLRTAVPNPSNESAFPVNDRGWKHVLAPNSSIDISLLLQGTTTAIFFVAYLNLRWQSSSRSMQRNGWMRSDLFRIVTQIFAVMALTIHLVLILQTTPGFSSPMLRPVICLIGCLISIITLPLYHSCVPRGFYHMATAVAWIMPSSQITESRQHFGKADLSQMTTTIYILALFLDIFRPYREISSTAAPTNNTNLFQLLTFSWLGPLLSKAHKQTLRDFDMWDLDEELHNQLNEDAPFNSAQKADQDYSFERYNFIRYRKYLLGSMALSFVDTCAKLAIPWLLRLLLQKQSFKVLLAMFAARILSAASMTHAAFLLRYVAGAIKADFAAKIFAKSLILTPKSRDTKLLPANLIENDMQRIQESLPLINYLWIAPFQGFIGIASVAFLLSWESAVCCMLVLLFLYPILKETSIRMYALQRDNMAMKDIRIKHIEEVIRNVNTIKFYGWEKSFENTVFKLRTAELTKMKAIAIVQGFFMSTMSALPQLMACLAFIVLFFQQGRLQYDVVFPALSFFQLIDAAFSSLSSTLTIVFASVESSKRIASFLGMEDNATDLCPTTSTMVLENPMVLMENTSLMWPTDGPVNKPFLLNLNMHIHTPQLVTISGSVGSGKSTLLVSLLDGIAPIEGKVSICGTVGYSPQSPWFIRSTIKENIILGMDFDMDWYETVLEACALVEDLKQLPEGDVSIIGAAGLGLSGGQRSRVMLARAIYSRAKIQLLDDPLAALDAATQKHVIEKVLGPRGILKDSIRIVTTSLKTLSSFADKAFVLQNGRMETSIVEVKQKETTEKEESLIDEVEVLAEDSSTNNTISNTTSSSTINAASSTLKAQSELPKRLPDRRVKFSVYLVWLRYADWQGWILVFLCVVTGRVIQVASTYSLKRLSEVEGNSALLYLAAFTTLCLLQAIFVFAFVMIAFHSCLLPAAQRVHAALTGSVLASPISFFSATSPGQILNRFTNDISKVDGPLASSAISLIMVLSTGATILSVLLLQSLWSLAYIVPLGLFYWYLQELYLPAIRDVKRIELGSRSPLLNSLQEAWAGQLCIKAFRQSDFFRQRYSRIIIQNIQAYFPMFSLELWLAFRLEMIANLVILMAGGLLIQTKTSSAMFGFTMSYVLQITYVLSTFVRVRTNLETDMISLERILTYVNSEAEGSKTFEGQKAVLPPAAWPTQGRISFRNFSASHGPDLPYCLHNISIDIEPGTRLAVVGRSGAGKSSLAMCIGRFLEASTGAILIDGINVCSLDLASLRSRIATIPQEAKVFAGTLRYNLDPCDVHDEINIREAVKESGLEEAFDVSGSDVLNFEIKASGSNISQGQIQLIAIARILLSNSKILILDEATASIDREMEVIIQRLLRIKMQGRTTITVAHRVDTILNYDKVLVLDAGRVVEYDHPSRLLSRPDSMFTALVKEAGFLEVATRCSQGVTSNHI